MFNFKNSIEFFSNFFSSPQIEFSKIRTNFFLSNFCNPVLKTTTQDWASNLTPSAKKNDFVYKCVRERGAHTKITVNGVSSYECVPGKGCQKHQRHFQAHSTGLLFRMFCKGHPALTSIVTEYIFRKMRPFFASKPSLR